MLAPTLPLALALVRSLIRQMVYATIVEFGAVDVLSAQLLVPYLAWSCYATALTYNIWLNN